MADDFHKTIDVILSANDYAMKAAAGAWMALAGAATGSSDSLNGIAAETAAEPGIGLVELADRLGRVGGWGDGAAALAMSVSRQLQNAGEASSMAAERAQSLLLEYQNEVEARAGKEQDATSGGNGAVTLQADKALAMHGSRIEELRREAESERDTLVAVFGEVIGGNAPPAPEVGAAAGGGVPGGGAVPVGAGGGSAASAGGGTDAPTHLAANGAAIGTDAYPYSSVVGVDGGDFAGWVRSPNTGFLVDPATGREFDPVSGRWIDPLTGRPFGEVTDYATRLAGLGGGPGGLVGAGGVGLVAVGGGPAPAGSGFAGLYGGVLPPSLAHTGPAQPQLARQAAGNLAHKAEVANRFAAREAAQGGRPYLPPPGAGSQAAATARGAAAASRARPRLFGEPPDTWRARAADASARHRLAGPAPAAGGAQGAARTGKGGDRRERRDSGTGSRSAADSSGKEADRTWCSTRRAGRGVLGE
ncbi:hypothetical protein ACFW4X_23975 [Streptomyces smyrnaeus]|uniref:hypothetical protein n=1 Tax=Streptomyces smyrnaeus TaxID=1387713 RepID=UPI00368BF36F